MTEVKYLSGACLLAWAAVACSSTPPDEGEEEEPGAVVEIAVGVGESCVRRESGRVQCWGLVVDGLDLTSGSPPSFVAGLTDAQQLALTDEWWCARRDSGDVACWGRADATSFGGGTISTSELPVPVAGLVDATQISASSSPGSYGASACALKSDGSVSCWGNNMYGQLGDGTTENRSTPVAVLGVANAVEISVGREHACARTDTAVLCWGSGFGNGNGMPVEVPGLTDAVELAVGGRHQCARLRSGEVACWGDGASGQLGDGMARSSATPVIALGLSDAVQIVAGNSTTCARKANGAVVCWGAAADGVLGNGDSMERLVPTPVVDLGDAAQIALSGRHACALRTEGNVVCWGVNFFGELGIPTSEGYRLTPTPVMGL